ncbi:MAG: hypothetical protein GF310_03675 [candidate division Zixibacteria bacterium]|nr:hypothetical protein [candidate division Zixibacteria bacterium]
MLLIAGVVLLSSCSEDCPTCPVEDSPEVYKGYLYVADNNGKIYQFDTETDSLVDSTYSLGRGSIFDVSQDGRYLVVNDWNYTPAHSIIFDAQTLEPMLHLDSAYGSRFACNDNLLIATQNDMLYFYSLPDFKCIGTDSIGNKVKTMLDDRLGLLYIASQVNTPVSADLFITYDYRNRQILDRWYLKDKEGNHLAFWDFDISSDSKRLYVSTQAFEVHGSYTLRCFDMDSHQIVWEYGRNSPFGQLCLSPDGKELYHVEGPWGDQGPEPGAVFISDPENGSILHTISTYGYTENPFEHLRLGWVRVTPTGDKLYAASGTYGWPGTVLVIDLKTREITKMLWPDMDHFVGPMEIGPKR